MKRTIQIHIGGRQFHINEDAYAKIKDYLEALKAHFAGEGASGREIIEDIEGRIAELFESKISESKQAISEEDVDEIIGVLGKAEDITYDEKDIGEEEYNQSYRERRHSRRLFRDPDHYYFGGVASGLAAYFDIDPLWIRLAFVALLFLKGLGLIIYIILWIAVPKARNTAEKLQMKGVPVNLSNIRDSVDAEYRKVKSSLHDLRKSPGVSRAGDILENIFRAFALVFMAILKFVVVVIGIGFIVAGSVFIIALIFMLLGHVNLFSDFHGWPGIYFPDLANLFSGVTQYNLLIISLLIVILIPIVAMVYQGIKILFNIRTRHNVLRAFTVTAWVLALVLCITLIIVNSTNFAIEADKTQTVSIDNDSYPRLYIEVRDNSTGRRIANYWVFGYRFRYSRSNEALYREPARFTISPSNNEEISLAVSKEARNVGVRNADDYLDDIHYGWEQVDSVLYLDRFFYTDAEDFWMFPQVILDLNLPEGQAVVLSRSACDMWDPYYGQLDMRDRLRTGKPAVMTSEGLVLLEEVN